MILINLAQEIGISPKKIAFTRGGEYHSECPTCGGKDRFVIQPNRQMKNCLGYYFCRQCETSGDSIQFCRDFLGLSFKEAVDRVDAVVPDRSFPSFNKLNKTNTHNYTQLKPLPSKWTNKANSFVKETHEQMLQQPKILKHLERRGVSFETIKQYKIGWNSVDLWNEKNDWGIEQSNKQLWLPKGIVIPVIDFVNGNVIRLKIRRYNWEKNDKFPKYIAVSGSMNGLNIIGNTRNNVMIIVESELDAYAVYNSVGDFAFVISVGSNIKNPDNVTDYLAKKKSKLLICYDNDDAGKLMLNKWKDLYSHAEGCSTNIGKDIGEAVKLGVDIRSWFVDIIYHKYAKPSWSSEEQILIEWALKYISERTVTKYIYKKMEKDIVLSFEYSETKTRKLIENIKYMKEAVDWLIKNG